MSVNETVPARNDATSSGGTDYQFTFAVYAENDLAVYLDGSLQTINSHYRVRNGSNPFTSLTAAQLPSAGFIQFLDGAGAVTALASGRTVSILRDQPFQQLSIYTANEGFPASRVSKDYDKIVMLAQQIEEVLRRTVRAPVRDLLDMTLPSSATRANNVLGFTSQGLPTAVPLPTAGGGDVSLATVLATSSTTARTLAERFAEQFHVKDYGAVGDGVTNDATAIQAAVDAAGAAGGGTVVFGPDVYAIGSTITNTYSNVLLQGQGAGYTSSRGPGNDYLTASTALLWIGSAGGTMVDIGPVVSATYSLFGGGVVGIFLEGDELAATGLKLRSVNNGIYDIVVEECTTVAVDIGVESTIAGGPGTQSNWFRRIVTIQQQTTSGIGVRLDGAGTFNVSLNVFGILTLLHRDALALDLGDTDGNTFNFVRVFRHGSGTSVAIRLRAGTSPDYARANQFFFVQAAAGGLVAEGLASGTSPSSSNIIHTYSLDNGSPLPVVEWGASLSYDTSRGLKRESRTDSWSVFQMHRASQTNGNNLGRVEFLGYDDAATPAEITYGYVNGIIRTATAGATDGTVRIAVQNAGVDTMQALFGDGVLIGASPTGSFLGVGTLNAVADLYKNGSNLTAREVVTYSTSMTPNQRNGCAHTITATNGTAFTINNPTNSIDGDIVTIMIRNTSGGALGVATFGAGYKLGAAWTQPATGFSRSIQFLNDGTNWVEINRTAADVSN